MKTLIDRQFEWNFWGNRRTLDMLKDNGGGTEKMRELMSHILATERVWLTRLEGMDSTDMEIFTSEILPPYDLERCAEYLDMNRHDWTAFLAGLSEEKLLFTLYYKNQSGSPFESNVADILLHVSSHGHYHRGQINALARAEGWQPVSTDYILFAREFESAKNI